MRKWQFNEACLKRAVDLGQKFLLDETLSRRQRREITSDIRRFQNFIDGNFEIIENRRTLNHPHIKKNILNSMKNLNRYLPSDLRHWFVELHNSQIFKYKKRIKTLNLSMDEMADETLAVYRECAPLFYTHANEILTNKDVQLVHSAKIDSSSFCFYSDILKLPFIVIANKDEAYSLNHELQHGIEYILGIQTPSLYSEFGPIYFESLFNDAMYEKYGKKSLSGPIHRIQEIYDYLDILSIYLYAMSVFSHHDFDVTDEFFYEVFSEATGLEKDSLIHILNMEFVNSEITETLDYVFSFLKAIEIRDYITRKQDDGRSMFNDLLFSKKFSFTPPKEGFEPYARFVDEIKQKAR